MELIELLGWVATGIFSMSFFFKDRNLKIIQGFGASLWVFYGYSINATPVMIANLIVLLSILFSILKDRGRLARRPQLG
jgi:hypothetical protein